jgi:clan AA aspartic protease (TIGR02281 family)
MKQCFIMLLLSIGVAGCASKTGEVVQNPLTLELDSAVQRDFVSVNADVYGLYYTNVNINGHPVSMIIDTGAYVVTISSEMAADMDLKCVSGQIKVATGNGHIQGCHTSIKSFQIGKISLENIDAIILPELVIAPLMGQSALKHLKVMQANNVLMLSASSPT